MNIDRHNYEECFLLYIDNELSVDQKKQVELFVQENPDLEEELVMLKQSRLIPDETIVFDKKHLLMKEENASLNHSFINLNNYEQWLVMYVDDELTEEEKLAVEKFASAHQHVQQELELFQQTRLQPEEIVFPNKEVLYRRETTVRIISIQWLRVAVAAVLVIAAGITLYSIFNKSSNKGITPASIVKTEQVPVPTNATSPAKEDQGTSVKEETEKNTAANAIDKEIKKEKEHQEQPKEEIKQQLAYNPIGQPIESIEDSKRVQPTTVEMNERSMEKSKMTDVAIDEKMHKKNINTDPVTIPVVETPDKSSTSDDAVQYASNTENKKFRGFFRKATRILERTTSINAAEDDKVLIGGMAINLK